jgi:hypothetical protein
MARKLIKDLSGSVIDTYNAQKAQARKAPKGFAIGDSVKVTEAVENTDVITSTQIEKQTESEVIHNYDLQESVITQESVTHDLTSSPESPVLSESSTSTNPQNHISVRESRIVATCLLNNS